MKRRQALLSACTVVASAGCLGFASPQPAKPRLAWIWLLNDRDGPYEVDVVVEDDSEQVFSDTYELGTEPDTANVHVDNPVDGAGQYVVRATVKYLGDKPRGFAVLGRTAPTGEFNSPRPSACAVGWN